MKHVLKNIVIAFAIMAVIFVIWVFRPYKKANVVLIDPIFMNIEEPCQKVIADCYGDGGSLGLKIIDRTGNIFEFCLPAPMDDPTYAYKRLFVGALYFTDTGATEVLNPYHSKLRLSEILRTIPVVDGDIDFFIYRLSGRWRDAWRYFRREFIFKVYED